MNELEYLHWKQVNSVSIKTFYEIIPFFGGGSEVIGQTNIIAIWFDIKKNKHLWLQIFCSQCRPNP